MPAGEMLSPIVLAEVSCVQYEPLTKRSKDDAERVAILKVCRKLRKRGFAGGIFFSALSHRNSGHIHIVVASDEDDEDLICRCCKEAQKPIRTRSRGARFKVCNCGDCVACDKTIRIDLEQLTRSRSLTN